VTRRLLASYVALAMVVLALLEVPLAVSFARNERHDLTTKVERDAVAIGSLSEDVLERGVPAPPALEALGARYARDTGGRVVVVDAKGSGVVDSAGTVRGDFSTRPEISVALGGTVATGVRHSNTLGTDLLYVAAPVASSGVVHGAVRITYPMAEVNARIHRYWLILATIAVSVLAVAVALGFGFVRWITRPLRRIEAAAGEVARGNLVARAPLDGPPELQQLAREFNEMVGKLDALLRSQDEFVADASHQLRTPLTALRLRLENLAREDVTHSDELDSAIDEVERLSALVDGLLTLARADRATSEPSALDVGAAIAERVEAWSAFASEQRVQLSAQVDGQPFASVTPGRIEQVLDNLLANALEVSAAGSSVDLAASQSSRWVEIAVRDRGPGMTAGEIDRAFDRFWRSGGREDGFGLGLTIVHRLVRADGGEVGLRRRVGGGLEAIVRLQPTVARAGRREQD
jgi:signal transduction histidine kinase